MTDTPDLPHLQDRLKGTGECPQCASTEVEGKSIDTDCKRATQDMYCLECGAAWTDNYTLSSVTMIEYGGLEECA